MKNIIMLFTMISVCFSTNLKSAKPGEHYKIIDDNIALLNQPKSSTNKDQFKKNVIVLLSSGAIVEILKTKGLLDVYHKVKVIKHGNVILSGWILANTVKSANKISKSVAYKKSMHDMETDRIGWAAKPPDGYFYGTKINILSEPNLTNNIERFNNIEATISPGTKLRIIREKKFEYKITEWYVVEVEINQTIVKGWIHKELVTEIKPN